MKTKMKEKITVWLSDDIIEYFKNHPELNMSEFVRMAVREKIKKY
ncbi:MAG: hypothetical protein QW046_03790 [Candidatus Micrarchaeaceae archaeon]